MRIISQDKETDIPYERSAFVIETLDKGNFLIHAYIYGKYFWLGTYNTLDDAKAVLSSIAAYKKAGRDYYELPQSDDDLEYAYRVM